MASLEKKKIIGKILYGKDNDSYMLNNFHDYEKCKDCQMAIGKPINLDFKLKKTSFDISNTYDGYTIVSSRFKKFCQDKKMQGLKFVELRNTLGFYVIFTENIVELDHEARKTSFKEFCPACGRYLSISGADPNFIKSSDFKFDNTIYRSDILYGFKNEQNYLLIVNLDIYKEMSSEKFKGISFSDIYNPTALI